MRKEYNKINGSIILESTLLIPQSYRPLLLLRPIPSSLTLHPATTFITIVIAAAFGDFNLPKIRRASGVAIFGLS